MKCTAGIEFTILQFGLKYWNGVFAAARLAALTVDLETVRAMIGAFDWMASRAIHGTGRHLPHTVASSLICNTATSGRCVSFTVRATQRFRRQSLAVIHRAHMGRSASATEHVALHGAGPASRDFAWRVKPVCVRTQQRRSSADFDLDAQVVVGGVGEAQCDISTAGAAAPRRTIALAPNVACCAYRARPIRGGGRTLFGFCGSSADLSARLLSA